MVSTILARPAAFITSPKATGATAACTRAVRAATRRHDPAIDTPGHSLFGPLLNSIDVLSALLDGRPAWTGDPKTGKPVYAKAGTHTLGRLQVDLETGGGEK